MEEETLKKFVLDSRFDKDEETLKIFGYGWCGKTFAWVWMRMFLEMVLETASKELPTEFLELKRIAQLKKGQEKTAPE